jgi:hypothetical protein
MTLMDKIQEQSKQVQHVHYPAKPTISPEEQSPYFPCIF